VEIPPDVRHVLTIRVHFVVSPPCAEVHPTNRGRAMSIPHRHQDVVAWCLRITSSGVQLRLTRWNSGLGTLAKIQVTTVFTIRVNYIQELHKATDMHRTAARPRSSRTLVAPNSRKSWLHHVQFIQAALCRNCLLLDHGPTSESRVITICGLLPVRSSRRQVPWVSRRDIIFYNDSWGNSPCVTFSLTKDRFVSCEYDWPSQMHKSHI
jgi:hypothetical protein